MFPRTDDASTDPVAAARRRFAQDLRRIADLRSPAVVAAFTQVPRERFLGPAPWRIHLVASGAVLVAEDPRAVYQDALIALDQVRGINNGQPSLWAWVFDRLGLRGGERILHLGCGGGYYTAILAELAGARGQVSAFEIDARLAAMARVALAPWRRVLVCAGDGARGPFEAADVIVASAGATHPLPVWVEALAPGGRLLLPLTGIRDDGALLLVTRQGGAGCTARLLRRVAFIGFQGARDAETGRRLDVGLRRDGGAAVRSLRSEPHGEDATCWLHGEGWCLSRREAAGEG